MGRLTRPALCIMPMLLSLLSTACTRTVYKTATTTVGPDSPAKALERKACQALHDQHNRIANPDQAKANNDIFEAARLDPQYLALQTAYQQQIDGAQTPEAVQLSIQQEAVACIAAVGVDVRVGAPSPPQTAGTSSGPTTTVSDIEAARRSCAALGNAVTITDGSGVKQALLEMLTYADVAARGSSTWLTFDQDAASVANEGLQSRFEWVQQDARDLASRCSEAPINLRVILGPMPVATTEVLPPSAPGARGA